MLKRLDDSFTRLSQFSADLAHELRTPIANMLGEAQVTLTRDRTAADYRETIESTVAECERLSRIVDNLLFVARVDAAGEPIARKWFDARAAVEKIAEFYQTVADDHHVTITCSGDGQIYADPDLFERAVGNLLDNALRFTPEHGSIRIAAFETQGDFEVSVSDNGCGIAAEHLPRVFDRFYRAESSRSSDGAGLGLALVKSIVDLHGGSAKIESEVGRGTTVKLTFPLCSGANSRLERARATRGTPSRGQRTKRQGVCGSRRVAEGCGARPRQLHQGPASGSRNLAALSHLKLP